MKSRGTAFPMARLRTALLRWFRQAGRDLPWRHTHDPYAILVSEIMLQQTQVATVQPYYRDWMQRFPDVRALATAREPEVLRHWQGLGYYARARNLHRAAQLVMERHGGVFPRSLDEIRALPGVGPYTAGAVASFAFDFPAPAVDTNIARVLARIAWIPGPVQSPIAQKKLWHIAALAASKHPRSTNSALMDLGALVCLPKAPRCGVCQANRSCAAFIRGTPEAVPVPPVRKKTVHVLEHCAWVRRGTRLLLAQESGPRWRGLWRLPRLGSAPDGTPPIVSITYPITHHRVRLAVFKATLATRTVPGSQWFDLSTLDILPMPSPHRRAVVETLHLTFPEKKKRESPRI